MAAPLGAEARPIAPCCYEKRCSSSRLSEAVSLSIARWAWADIAKRCLKPHRKRESSASIAIAAALSSARERLAHFGERFRAVHADFRELERILRELEEAQLGRYPG